MADFLQKYTLTAGTPVTIDTSNYRLVAYDFTNDSPFDIDIQWGSNKPIALTVPPTTLWRGARPAAALLIPGNQWGGIVIATPSFPLGGTPPSGAPAMQLTVHGYEKGNEPPEQVMNLNRLQNVGNSVPLNASSTSVANDGTLTGTEFIEASISGTEHVGIFTDGFMRLEKSALSADTNLLAFIDLAAGGHNWEIWLKTGATHALYINDLTSGNTPLLLLASGGIQTDGGKIVTDGSGNITAVVAITPSGLVKNVKNMASADQDFYEIAPADDTANIDFALRATFLTSDLVFFDKKNAGEMFRIKNTAGANSGIIVSGIGGRVRAWSFFTGNASGNYNHGLGATPNVVLLNASAVGSETLGWDTPTATQVHITNGATIAWTAMALLMA